MSLAYPPRRAHTRAHALPRAMCCTFLTLPPLCGCVSLPSVRRCSPSCVPRRPPRPRLSSLLQTVVREEERWARMEAEKAEEEERLEKLRATGAKVMHSLCTRLCVALRV